MKNFYISLILNSIRSQISSFSLFSSHHKLNISKSLKNYNMHTKYTILLTYILIKFPSRRLNKADIRKVTVSRKESIGPSLNISNILVHENFKSPVSKNQPENNDLGITFLFFKHIWYRFIKMYVSNYLALASLTVPIQGEACIPCFSQKNTITNEVCKTFQTTNYKNAVKSGL